MNIVLFGASGTIGRRIADEALRRGHSVTGVVRNPEKLVAQNPRVKAVKGNASDADEIAHIVRGADVVISAIGPAHDSSETHILTDAARALLVGAKDAEVKRLVVVGGAGGLEVTPGVQLADTPSFPAAWKDIANEHRKAFEIYKANTDVNWSYFAPADIITPGERTGVFRLGGDQLITDQNGKSSISAEDFAVALMNEVEAPTHVRQRFTAAY